MLKRPADEGKDSVCRGFGGDVGVGVESVQHTQSGELEVAEDILGDQRWSEQQRQVRGNDPRSDRPPGEDAGRGKRRGVSGAQEQRPNLEARRADTQPKAVQGSVQPARPTSDARRHILCGLAGGAGHHTKQTRHDRHQPGHPQRAQRRRRAHRLACRGATVRHGRYAFHVACAESTFTMLARRPSVHRVGKA
jgi:hypothetical protein